ncbi:MAG: zinc-ribbon domain-containing protein, partial [Deltaproteobacteria bacterium]|nr:zinc-ribbon domain-containing protein [Deltaproteobacteria bacterium]
MLIECQNCQKKLNISDDKIPFGRPFTFICPQCKVKNTMTLPERRITEISLDEGETPEDPPVARQPTAPPRTAPKPSPSSTQTGQVPLPPPGLMLPPEMGGAVDEEDLPEGMKAAMIAFDTEENQEKLIEKLSTLGYRTTTAINVRDAVKQLKFGRFQLLIIQEDYYGASLATNQIIRAVNSIELSIRHDMFVAVVGPSFTSLDDLTAFSLSLDTVINTSDLDDIERILISAMSHVKKFM